MSTVNKRPPAPPVRTHEGAIAVRIGAEQELRRTLMACLLWEDTFYESGEDVAARIARLVKEVKPEAAAALAIEARTTMKLRHAPLWVAVGLARQRWSGLDELLPAVIQRADELTEFLALYWKDGRQPISAAAKRGLRAAFTKFSAYSLAKYNRDGAVKLRDVMFMVSPKPKDDEQAATFKALAADTLAPPDTWEVALSGGADKRATFERLIGEQKLGAMALVRNLRNMAEAGVPEATVRAALTAMDTSRLLPFRFITAAKAAPRFEPELDAALLRGLAQQPKLPGRTVVVVDVSGSMYGHAVSMRSEVTRAHAACALGAIAREICEDVVVYATAGSDSARVHSTQEVPPRRGLPLIDAIYDLCRPLGGGGIFLNQVMKFIASKHPAGTVTRTIVVTDEQDCAVNPADRPDQAVPLGTGYLVNVATYKNGIGYKPHWTHIDGWSEGVLGYIAAAEGAVAPLADAEEEGQQ